MDEINNILNEEELITFNNTKEDLGELYLLTSGGDDNTKKTPYSLLFFDDVKTIDLPIWLVKSLNIPMKSNYVLLNSKLESNPLNANFSQHFNIYNNQMYLCSHLYESDNLKRRLIKRTENILNKRLEKILDMADSFSPDYNFNEFKSNLLLTTELELFNTKKQNDTTRRRGRDAAAITTNKKRNKLLKLF